MTAWVPVSGCYMLETISLVSRALMDNNSNAFALMSKELLMGLVMPNTDEESNQEYVYRNQVITSVAVILNVIPVE